MPKTVENEYKRNNMVIVRLNDIELKKLKRIKQLKGIPTKSETVRHVIDRYFDTIK